MAALVALEKAAGASSLRKLGPLQEEDVAQAMQEEEEKQQQRPQVGDRVIVLKEPWLQLILEGKKTMELRGCKARPGFVWVAMKGNVYGSVIISRSVELSAEAFRARAAEHHWPQEWALPYERLCGLLLADAKPLPSPVPYWRPPAAIGWNVFRRGPEDMPAKGAKPQRARRAKRQEEQTQRKRPRKVQERPAAAAAESPEPVDELDDNENREGS